MVEWPSFLLALTLLCTLFGLTALTASAALLLKAAIYAAVITAMLSVVATGVVGLF